MTYDPNYINKMEKIFKKRINYTGDLKNLSIKIAKDFKLGNYRAYKIIPIGYEDFNFFIKTTKGKFFVKIFSTQRTLNDAKRIVGIMSKMYDAQIAIPKLYKSDQGNLHLLKDKGVNLRICVMSFIDGKDFFSSGNTISNKDINFIAYQAALINKLKITPKKVYDSWAISNFLPEFKKKNRYLDKDDLSLIKPLVADFKNLKIKSLPHCFAHGDIIKTNIIKDKRGKIWLIDFSVANKYPRIQELAVLACDVLFDSSNQVKSQQKLKQALKEYQKTITLTEKEKKSLPVYIKLAHAMHVLCATYEKKVNNNNSKENKYFLNIGRIGLRRLS